MDVVVLGAVLPGEPAFIAKSEFAPQFFAGNFLRRLGALFVERYDTSASLADTEKAISMARQGRNIVVFPEGAFTRRAGLSEFYLGAFKVAAAAAYRSCPASSVERGPCSVAVNGFPAGLRLASRSKAPSCPPEKTLRQCCACAMKRAKPSLQVRRARSWGAGEAAASPSEPFRGW